MGTGAGPDRRLFESAAAVGDIVQLWHHFSRPLCLYLFGFLIHLMPAPLCQFLQNREGRSSGGFGDELAVRA